MSDTRTITLSRDAWGRLEALVEAQAESDLFDAAIAARSDDLNPAPIRADAEQCRVILSAIQDARA